jgi:hypothetical protein
LNKKYKPVIIIGAPRSGTNMLRDLLCDFDGVATWPCDEVNYMWRYGNAHYPSDALPEAKATKKIQRYIVKQFDWVANKYNATIVVEKTCANSLRIPFVNKIINDAKYIFIIRDGVDTIGSSISKRKANLDLKYIIKKIRFVPIFDIPFYAIQYFSNRIKGLISSDKGLKYWGPKLNNISNLVEQNSLSKICSMQWKECVENSEKNLSVMSKDQVLTVYYEKLVNDPFLEIKKIISFIGLEVSDEKILFTIKGISSSSVGKGQDTLTSNDIIDIESIIGEILKKHGYDTNFTDNKTNIY